MWALPGERWYPMPGDRLLADPLSSRTHGITIRGPRSSVWPWLVQMGAGRAGWYSYDFIDNGGAPSAECIVPELQQVNVGDVLPALPGVTEGFTVLRMEPEHSLVLGWSGPRRKQPLLTWAYVLNEPVRGTTRLVVRARSGDWRDRSGMPPWPIRTYTAWGHPLMQQKQLIGIARRVKVSRSCPAALVCG